MNSGVRLVGTYGSKTINNSLTSGYNPLFNETVHSPHEIHGADISISSHFTILSEEHYSIRTYLTVPLHDGLHAHLQLHLLYSQGLELRWQRLLRPVSVHRCLRRPAPDHYLKTFLLLLRSKERPWRWPLAGEPFQPGTSGDYHTRINHANQRCQHKNWDSVPTSPTPVCTNYER